MPFVVFVVLTALQGQFGPSSAYWLYLAKTAVGAWMIWSIRDTVLEMRWTISWEAVAAGVAVFVLWVGIDGFYPKLSKPGTAWNPFDQFGNGSALAWLFVAVRVVGSSLIVPPLEEVFFRSFLYRYLISPEFLAVPLARVHRTSFVLVALIFGFEHNEWLAGILCGVVYQWLVCRKGRLGDAITAHAITNFLLGLWVLWRGAWNFW